MSQASDLVKVTRNNGVATILMNNPKKLNGWTFAMIEGWKGALTELDADDDVKVIILTGTDPYYSAGVNLGGTLQPAHPATLHKGIREYNAAVFQSFIDLKKPIIAAVNGPAIGAAVTTATMCDAIVASEKATFSTPFARLGVPAEGCSSVTFPKMLGEETADRILGKEGWKPTGKEAAEIGLATEVVPHEELLERAQALAEQWMGEGRERQFPCGLTRQECTDINERESKQIADAFLSPPFLKGQYEFLRSKGKKRLAIMFWTFWRTRPLWARMLPDDAETWVVR